MIWPIAIFVYVLWLGLMTWTVRARGRTFGLCLLFVTGYVFLPVPVDSPISEVFGLKAAAVSIAGAVLLFVGKREDKIRWPALRWWELFMLAWLAVQIVSEIINHRPPSAMGIVAAELFIQWILPYTLGRIVLREPSDFLTLARMAIYAALALVLPALYESLTGWYVHKTLYGVSLVPYAPPYHLILNAWGPMNFRPLLFFEGSHLASAFYFGAAAFIQLFLMASGSGAFKEKKWNILTLLLLFATTINSRAFLGTAVLIGGFVVLWSLAGLRTRALVVLMLLFLPAYAAARATNLIPTPMLMHGQHADPLNKNYSLWFRMLGEQFAIETINQRHAQWFGLGSTVHGGQGWRQETWVKTGIDRLPWIDSLWAWLVIRTGWVGFSIAYLAVASPLMAAIWAIPRSRKGSPVAPETGACLAMLAVVAFDLMDWSMNPHESVAWAFTLGGLTTICAAWRSHRTDPPIRLGVVEIISR